jgi:uncharacterized protein (DUF2141 family)
MSVRALPSIAAALAALLALMPIGAASAASAGAPLEVEVTNVTQARGHIHVDVCTEKTFVTSNCAYVADAPATLGTTIVTVPNVPPGHYAVQVFHDRDSNGHVNRNFLGIPTEPVGFSNDAPTRLAPPKYSDAVFEHGAASQRIRLKLRSFL